MAECTSGRSRTRHFPRTVSGETAAYYSRQRKKNCAVFSGFDAERESGIPPLPTQYRRWWKLFAARIPIGADTLCQPHRSATNRAKSGVREKTAQAASAQDGVPEIPKFLSTRQGFFPKRPHGPTLVQRSHMTKARSRWFHTRPGNPAFGFVFAWPGGKGNWRLKIFQPGLYPGRCGWDFPDLQEIILAHPRSLAERGGSRSRPTSRNCLSSTSPAGRRNIPPILVALHHKQEYLQGPRCCSAPELPVD